MLHSTKIKRALTTAEIGKRPKSAAVMLGYLPSSVINKVSAAVLSDIVDGLWKARQRMDPKSHIHVRKSRKGMARITKKDTTMTAEKNGDQPNDQDVSTLPKRRGRPPKSSHVS